MDHSISFSKRGLIQQADNQTDSRRSGEAFTMCVYIQRREFLTLKNVKYTVTFEADEVK